MIEFYHNHQAVIDAVAALIVITIRSFEKHATIKRARREGEAAKYFRQ